VDARLREFIAAAQAPPNVSQKIDSPTDLKESTAAQESGAGKAKPKIKGPQPGWIPERWAIIETYLNECVQAGIKEPSRSTLYSADRVDRSEFYDWLRGQKKPKVEKAIRRICQVEKPHLLKQN
jgi:hypothetical protein